jgi:8-oxo-dGTP pyrophosphatase MutT (NUDIX family)
MSKKIIELRNKWITVWKESLQLPNGTLIPEYYFVQKPDFVIIVPLTDSGKVIMLRQWRPIPNDYIYNLPMGFIEPTDRSPKSAAIRELKEEVNCESKQWINLGTYWRAPSFLTTKAHFFLALCEKNNLSGIPQDSKEDAFPEIMSLEKASAFTTDLSSLTALLLAQNWLEKRPR